MLTLYDFAASGNGYKVRLLLNQLGIPYRYMETDILKGETRTEEFQAINPNGKIPAVVLEDGRVLCESNAILYYFARDTAYFPGDAYRQAQALQWLFFEQYSHEPAIAVSRFIRHYLPADHPRRSELPLLQPRGHAALRVMEQTLRAQPFLVGEDYSIADIGLYAYTHVADEGGFELTAYPGIRAWLERVRQQPGHVAIHHT
jgi:glutathione S-transferase